MASLQDAHTLYAVPAGYRVFVTVRAFSIVSRLVNGTQEFYSAPSVMTPVLYSKLCDCSTNLEEFYGRRILNIAGLPVAQYLEEMGRKFGVYLDPGAQMNNLLSTSSAYAAQSLAFMAPAQDSEMIVFDGDFVGYSFNNYMTTTKAVKNTSDIIKWNKPSTTMKRDGEVVVEDSLIHDEEAILELVENQLAQKAKLSAEDVEVMQNLKATFQKSIAGAKIRSKTSLNAISPAMRMQRAMEGWYSAMSIINKVPKMDDSRYPKNAFNVEHEKHTISEEAKRSASAFSVNTSTVTLLKGEPDWLVTYEETDALSYWSYAETTVIRLKSFLPDDIDEFQKLFNKISHSRHSNGLSNNLILDVSGNGGGYVCLSYTTLAYMARPWNSASLQGNDILFSPYDFRQSDITDDLFRRGFFGAGGEEISEETRKPLGASFYNDRVPQTYESFTSNYTQRYLWDLCEASDYKLAKTKSNVFDKVLIVSDGRCGSACSYFISKMRLGNKARVVTYGGIWGRPMDASSFAGGNVYEWNEFASDVKSVYKGLSWTQTLPTTSLASFNFREMYNPGESIPRQFTPMYPDFALPYWDPLLGSRSFKDPAQKEALANMYASLVPVFEKIPPGLLGTNSNKSLVVALSIIVCIMIAAVIVTIIVAVIVNRKSAVKAEYGELSASDI